MEQCLGQWRQVINSDGHKVSTMVLEKNNMNQKSWTQFWRGYIDMSQKKRASVSIKQTGLNLDICKVSSLSLKHKMKSCSSYQYVRKFLFLISLYFLVLKKKKMLWMDPLNKNKQIKWWGLYQVLKIISKICQGGISYTTFMIETIDSYIAKPWRVYKKKGQEILHTIDILPIQSLMESSILANLL